MAGRDRRTGQPLSGWPEVAQSLDTILSTAIGDRVRRRAFGLDDRVLQDRPMNAVEMTDAFVAIAEAIEPRDLNGRQYGEPRFDLVRVLPVRAGPDGVVGFELQGLYYPLALIGDFTVFERQSYTLGQ
ncbi:MAG: baseplate assembly protein [Beijerinckiaceae bacterium]|nr:baseplate assembly protein [Beijerinckiaceae bacterium]